jgi:hypothetical protein
MSTETPTSDDTEIYRQLEVYPWDTDKEFQVRALTFQTIPDQPRQNWPKHQLYMLRA